MLCTSKEKMEYSVEYGKAFEALAERMNFDFPRTPYGAIQSWQEVIEQIKIGYEGIQPELDYELIIIREPIEAFLATEDLANFAEHTVFRKLIH
jgi:hypothetical protein